MFKWEEGDDPAYACASCGHSFCLVCIAVDPNHPSVGPAHPGLTCEGRRRQLRLDEAEALKFKKQFKAWQRQNGKGDEGFDSYLAAQAEARRCPSCNMAISRISDCDHMTCPREFGGCGCNFCLVCGKHSAQDPTSRGDCGSMCRNDRARAWDGR